MFVAIYRWRLHPGMEASFATGWKRITDAAIRGCGSGGSALFRAEDGTYVGIARWESRIQRDNCFAGPPLDPAASKLMSDAVAERFPEQIMESVMDLWTAITPLHLA